MTCTTQDAVPADDSLISRMLRTTNRETGLRLTHMQAVAQSNAFLVAGKAKAPLPSPMVWPVRPCPDVSSALAY
jgi:hypothetical protein